MITITAEYLRSQGLSPTIVERFWSKVDVRGPNECWPWKASQTAGGYGQIMNIDKPMRSNRVAWLLSEGEIPDGMDVCHECTPGPDNKACCNPAHLKLDNHSGNGFDAFRKGQNQAHYGESSHTSKLTEKQVIAIRSRYANGDHRISAMGREFGVSKHQIFMIVSGRKWSHIKTDYQPIQRITLTQAIADRIRLMRNKGSTARAIAEHFGVGLSAVKHVICGDRW